MTTAVTRTDEELVAAARALTPFLREHADEAERERRLPLIVVEALKQAGAIRMTFPRSLGGLEAHPLTQFRVLEALSMADGSAGWCAYIGGAGGLFSAYLRPEVAREMFPSPDTIGGGGARPTGRAVAVEGGYRISGRWPFGSGCQHATWLSSGCLVFDGDAPRLTAEGHPATMQCFLPAADVQIIDTWTTTGLRGSGSHDYTIEDCFVPEARTFDFFTSPIYEPGPLYQFRRMFLLNHAAVALGIARAAIDALVALAAAKKLSASAALRDEAYVQTAVARAETLVGSARGYVFAVIEEIWETLVAGGLPDAGQLARFRLAIVHSHTAAVEAVDTMYHVAGGSALYAGHPLDRMLRDIHTINQHTIVSPKTYETAGRLLLGLDAGTPFF